VAVPEAVSAHLTTEVPEVDLEVAPDLDPGEVLEVECYHHLSKAEEILVRLATVEEEVSVHPATTKATAVLEAKSAHLAKGVARTMEEEVLCSKATADSVEVVAEAGVAMVEVVMEVVHLR